MTRNGHDVNEVRECTDVDAISARYCQHRDVDDVNNLNEVLKGTDVDTISSTLRCRQCER